MATLGFNLPRISDSSDSKNKEIKEIKEYLYQLTEQLRYVLMNLDTENFNDGFSDTLSDEIKNSMSATETSVRGLSSSLNTLSGRITAINSSLSSLPRAEYGSETLTAGTDTEITFEEEFTQIPFVGAAYTGTPAAGEEWPPVTVHSVTKTGAKLKINGTVPATAGVTWTATGK